MLELFNKNLLNNQTKSKQKIKPTFHRDIFEKILGCSFTEKPEYTLIEEGSTEKKDGRNPNLCIGYFQKNRRWKR